MSVVLRCPSCGTSAAAPGECDACHEAQLRYFCTNHNPGVWLDGKRCPTCGAGFGESTARRPPAAVSAAPAARRPPTPVRRPEVVTTTPPPRSRAAHRRAEPPISTPEPVFERTEDELDRGESRLELWQKVFGAVVRARGMASRVPAPRAGLPLARAGGCLLRLLLLVGLVIVAAVVAAIFFGRALLQGMSP